ncbi:MAG: Wzz/FepE/Etk N-terminal domain-containing protein [Patescibacteria group bacterium]|nr:Wzz/FepE/Etk N-terminal domain-containing protein [Patescibacteria group bacterium]
MNLNLLIKKRGTIAIILVVFVLIAFIVTMLQPLKYGAKSKILVVQDVPAGLDPYALARSNAYLSVVLSKIVSTNSFYEKAVSSDLGVERRYFEIGNDIEKTTKKWKKTVRTKASGDTGIIEINVVHPDREQAEVIANAVFQILANEHEKFHGGDNVEIKTIDSPIVSQASPNIPVNFAIALLIGVLTSLFYIFQYPEDEHDFKLSKKRNNLVMPE